MGNMSTQSSILPCSIPGLSGLYRARVSMCSGTSSLPTWWTSWFTILVRDCQQKQSKAFPPTELSVSCTLIFLIDSTRIELFWLTLFPKDSTAWIWNPIPVHIPKTLGNKFNQNHTINQTLRLILIHILSILIMISLPLGSRASDGALQDSVAPLELEDRSEVWMKISINENIQVTGTLGQAPTSRCWPFFSLKSSGLLDIPAWSISW